MVDFATLDALFKACKGRVKYKLGAKAPLDAEPPEISKIDCSGWARYHLFHATGVRWPDGSQTQLAFARKKLRKLAKYSDVGYAANDPSRLFIAFLSPSPGADWPRHVWLVKAGRTMESCSSLGVGSRPWDTKILMGCKECFEVV